LRVRANTEIRDAVVADAPAACDVLRRSIAELCGADHKGDPAILERWLANKTPESVASWMTQPGNSVLLAVEGDRDHAELRLARCTISRSEPGAAARARSSGSRARRYAVQADE
jgi:hypothetical protein